MEQLEKREGILKLLKPLGYIAGILKY